MGNCLKTSTQDDISLLHDSDIPDVGESSAAVVPPPPPYQVSLLTLYIQLVPRNFGNMLVVSLNDKLELVILILLPVTDVLLLQTMMRTKLISSGITSLVCTH